jgi:hypothetical protein
MSSILYGRLTRDREAARPDQRLKVARILPSRATSHQVRQRLPAQIIHDHPGLIDSLAAQDEAAPEATATDAKDVSHWVDILAALIPAETLGLHALLMAFVAKTSTDADGNPLVSISDHATVKAMFWVLTVLAGFLFLTSTGNVTSIGNWFRAFLVSVAFVCWTMIQKGTAFDALGWTFDPEWLRTMVPSIAAVVIGVFVNTAATSADKKKPGT